MAIFVRQYLAKFSKINFMAFFGLFGKKSKEEKDSLDEVDFDIDLLDFCINPVKGLELLKASGKKISYAVIQPGAGSNEIEDALFERGIPFVNGCVLRELEKEGRYSFEDSNHR